MEGKGVASLVLLPFLLGFLLRLLTGFRRLNDKFCAVGVGYLDRFFLSRSERWPYWKRLKTDNWPFWYSIVSDKTSTCFFNGPSSCKADINKSFSRPTSLGSWERSKNLSNSFKRKTLLLTVSYARHNKSHALSH